MGRKPSLAVVRRRGRLDPCERAEYTGLDAYGSASLMWAGTRARDEAEFGGLGCIYGSESLMWGFAQVSFERLVSIARVVPVECS